MPAPSQSLNPIRDCGEARNIAIITQEGHFVVLITLYEAVIKMEPPSLLPKSSFILAGHAQHYRTVVATKFLFLDHLHLFTFTRSGQLSGHLDGLRTKLGFDHSAHAITDDSSNSGMSRLIWQNHQQGIPSGKEVMANSCLFQSISPSVAKNTWQ